jgi:ribosomal protein L35
MAKNKKLKTKKTLMKRVKITKSGIILKKQNDTGHLKRKWASNKKHRKLGLEAVESSGYRKNIKKLLGKQGKRI